jgi:hypothetical protein
MTNPDSLACVFVVVMLFTCLNSKLAHLQIHYHQSILLAPFHCLDTPHSHTTLTVDNRNLIQIISLIHIQESCQTLETKWI